MTYFRQCLDDAEANANVGYALIQHGDFAGARDYYAKALSINPKLKSAQHALLQIAEWEQAKQKKLAQAAQPSATQAAYHQEHLEPEPQPVRNVPPRPIVQPARKAPPQPVVQPRFNQGAWQPVGASTIQ